MTIYEKEKYDLYGIVTDITPSTNDTYPVILQIESGEKVVIRLNPDIKVIKGLIYHVVGTGGQYKTKVHIYVDEIVALDDIKELSDKEKTAIENKILGNVEIDSEVAINYCFNQVDSIENKVLKDITKEIINKYKDKFVTYPAATKFHHAYKGGLIYHTFNALRLGKAYSEIYPHINLDLIISGIVLHDIMKVSEINGFNSEYTVQGKLIGHVSLIGQEIEKVAYKLGYENEEEVLLLKHITISHHLDGAYGSPKRPQIIEALIVHLADLADAKIEPIIEALDKTQMDEFSEQINVCEKRRFYKHKLSK